MKPELARLFEKYEPLGRWEAGELLLLPVDAFHFADELQAIKVVIVGVDVWHYVDQDVCEDLCGLVLSGISAEDNPVERSVAAAKRFITEQLPPEIDLVSFVVKED